MFVTNSCTHESCPICNSQSIVYVGDIKYRDPVSYSSSTIFLSEKPQLWHCQSCDSGFTQYCVNEIDSKKIYQTSKSSDRWVSAPFAEKHCKNIVNYLQKLFLTDECATVLDIGCNTGELLDFAKSYGCITSGLEYSSTAKSILAEKGHIVYGDFGQITNEFDFIFAFDLIEHVYDVPSFLKDCKKLLKPKGELILLTGNINSTSACLAAEHWWYISYPEHIVFPSQKYLGSLKFITLNAVIKTYASRGYDISVFKRLCGFLKLLLKGKRFNGLPPLGPDHHLICFQNNQLEC